jgi:hypothetical protein
MATLPPDQLRIIRAKLITNSGQPTIENIVSVLRETIPTITKTQLISNADTPRIVKLAWIETLHFERNSPTVATIAAALQLTDSQVDDLFISA